MNAKERQAVFAELVEEENDIIAVKGMAYAGDHDTNDNFKRNAQRLGLTKYQIWAVYFNKHIDAINNAIAQAPTAPVDRSEGLKGRILDVRVYAGLLAALLAEDAWEAKDASQGAQSS